MNRPIKFRAWSKKSQTMIQVTGYWWEEEGCNSENLAEGFSYDKYVLMQYIGLKDKNGKEIYEGDILIAEIGKTYFRPYESYETALVVWSPFGKGFVMDTSGRHGIGDEKYGDYYPILKWDSQERVSYMIIGNIFENPELLKK